MARRNWATIASLLAVLYGSVLFAGFFAPYSPIDQNRAAAFVPPARLHLWSPNGRVAFGGSEEGDKAAAARAEQLPADRAGVDGRLIPAVDARVAHARLEVALQKPGFV